MDIQAYLTRLKFHGEIRPTRHALFGLQEAHLCSIPFENLDIHAGRLISLDPDLLFHKIVAKRRGGFCYELNGLFHLLLQELGFHVGLAMGKVYDRKRNAYGPDFDHMLLLAEVDGESWLADVGFGDFAMHPLKLTMNEPLADANGQFLMEQHDDEFIRVSRYSPEAGMYVAEYLFSTKERTLPDFSDMCLFHQTSPESHFTKQKLCSVATPTGRVTLTGDRLIITDNGIRTEVEIGDERGFDKALAKHFDIALP